MSEPPATTDSSRGNLLALGLGALMVACCAAGPALFAVAGGLALGMFFAPVGALLLLVACLLLGRRLLKRGGRC